MRRCFFLLAAALSLAATCCNPVKPDETLPSSEKLSGITYQLNVYSFADSDGDGWGDLNGVTQHLDYLDALGATALWLSPVQTANSYHNYDVTDYHAINPKLGTEADFRNLIEKARVKNIDIYMDYVLNHSGCGDWFKSAVSSESSPYRSYYVLSKDPAADVAAGKVDNFAGARNPGMGSWYTAAGGELGYHGRLHFKLDVSSASAPKLTVTETTDAAQSANSDSSVSWFIYENNAVRMYKTGNNVYEITLEINNDWGVLVKDDATQWGDHKWGAKSGDQPIEFGKAKTLVKGDEANDIIFSNNVIQYFASFDRSMPDFNYGPYATASESAAFKDLANSADKWIRMGVKGLRLDAVMWIYQQQAEANASFLKQWYDRCNATYKACGGQGDMYMVGEAWEECQKIAPYYKGLPSLFNFSYWWTVKDRIQKGKGNDFAKTVIWFRNQYRQYRQNFIDAIKLSNHDEDRTGSDLNRSTAKMKLAGAILLTSPGKPFIYQGEELGYWGQKDRGDEYVRPPIKWTSDGRIPTSALGGKIDVSMLSGDISVEYQLSDEESVLNTYKNFARARNTNKALAKGEIEEVSSSVTSVALWKMTYEDQTVLVAHNFSESPATVTASGLKPGKTLVSNGKVGAKGEEITLSPYASAVFML